MNTYYKFAPNVFLAQCTEAHEKGEIIPVTTKYGKENDSIVYNLIAHKNGFFYYSIVRADGMNAQEFARKKAERLAGFAATAEKKSDAYYEASNEGRDFLVLAEPIKVGHHSEKRHRALIERNHNRMGKSIEFSEKAAEYEARAEYWESKTNVINLSMPESIEFYEYKLEKATEYHEGLKSGKYPREHSFSLTYAKKEVNELTKNLELAKKLWGDEKTT
jgi:hypothetical protein